MVTKATKITVDLGNPGLYKAVKILAIERSLTLREVVIDALKDWVEKQEELEDLAAVEEVKGEPTRPLEEFLSEIGERGLLRKNN